MPRFRDYPQASSLQSTDALELDRIGVGTMWVDGLDLVVNGPYLFSFENTGLPLTTSELVGGHAFGLACSVSANMAGSQVVVLPSSLPAGTTVIDCYLLHEGAATHLGTLTIQTDGTYAFATSAFAPVIGDLFYMVGPTLYDPHLANIFFTGYGTIS